MKTIKKDIENLDDIKELVNQFYTSVQKDNMIGPIFDEVIEGRWPEHLEKMYTFWETILLDNHSYHGRPFPPHANLPIERNHFERWLELFKATLSRLFDGPKADEAFVRARNMAELFIIKLEHIRKDPFRPLI